MDLDALKTAIAFLVLFGVVTLLLGVKHGEYRASH